jgi:hypothetical protein
VLLLKSFYLLDMQADEAPGSSRFTEVWINEMAPASSSEKTVKAGKAASKVKFGGVRFDSFSCCAC